MSKSRMIDRMNSLAINISKSKIISTISQGMMTLLPALMIGTLGSLGQQIPFAAYQNFINSTGLMAVFTGMVDVTTNMFSVYAVFSLAYVWAKNEKKDGVAAGVIALVSFMLVTPMDSIPGEWSATTVLPLTWLGSTGLFTAMIIAIVSAKIYCFFVERHITIKMPDSVPPFISKNFAAIIPGFAITILWAVLGNLVKLTPFGSLHNIIYSLIAAPLTGISTSFPAVIVALLLTSACWFLGIHGMAVAMITMPLWMVGDMANVSAISAGGSPENILTYNWIQTVSNIGGSGCTIGLVILCFFFAKSARYKQLSRLAIVPSFFSINEPVVFGMPMMLNFTTVIPFVCTPAALTALSYLLVRIGILPIGNGLAAPATIPILTGFFNMGWRGAVWNAVEILLTIVIYYPFFKKLDAQAVAEENAETAEAE